MTTLLPTYVSQLRDLCAKLKDTHLTEREQSQVRDLVAQLKAICDQAEKRSL